MIYKNSKGLMEAEVVTWLPDADYWDDQEKWKKTFVGVTMIEDWEGNQIKGFDYATDGRITNLKVSDLGTSTSMIEVTCRSVPWYTCGTVPSMPELGTYCHVTGYDQVCTFSDTGGGTGGGGVTVGSGTGGGTSPGDYPPTQPKPCAPALVSSKGNSVSVANPDCYTNPDPTHLSATFTKSELENATVAPDIKPAITDIDKFIKCFTNGQTGTYKLTIYVDQPVAGRNDQFLYYPLSSPSITGIGVYINGAIYDRVTHLLALKNLTLMALL